MAVTKETYYTLFDAHVTDINKNGEAIEAQHAHITSLEIQLATERARLDGLRDSRKAQFVQLKGVREIIRALEDNERVAQRAIEDAGTE